MENYSSYDQGADWTDFVYELFIIILSVSLEVEVASVLSRSLDITPYLWRYVQVGHQLRDSPSKKWFGNWLKLSWAKWLSYDELILTWNPWLKFI